VKALALTARDDDGDGIADRLEGQGQAQGSVIRGDQGFTVNLDFKLSGLPDVQRPSLIVPTPLHPLDGVQVVASEPVALTCTLSLSDAATPANQVALTGYTASNGALGRFSSPMVLPFGSTWNLVAKGADLAGLSFITPTTAVKLLADPGLFAQDGFETAPRALLSGTAAVVSHVGTLSALTGTQSLFVAPGSSATLHLAGSQPLSHVRFSTRTLSTVSGFSAGTPPLAIATIGGSQRLMIPNRPTAAAPTATGDSTWPYAAPQQDYDLPLLEAGTDVVIRIAPSYCVGLCPTLQAVLLDDVVVE
jgi:hypothetical protein